MFYKNVHSHKASGYNLIPFCFSGTISVGERFYSVLSVSTNATLSIVIGTKFVTLNIRRKNALIIIVHENYSVDRRGLYRNDIALIRLNESVPLHSEDPSQSMASPVCLPWSDYLDDFHPARDIKDLDDDGDFLTMWQKAVKSFLL